jgi:hypothetical protein
MFFGEAIEFTIHGIKHRNDIHWRYSTTYSREINDIRKKYCHRREILNHKIGIN